MKLNIISAASNSLGQEILKKVANPHDITVGLSRKGCTMDNVIDGRITDLSCKETTEKELLGILSTVDLSGIDTVNFYHGCGYVVAEIPADSEQYPGFVHGKVVFQDQFGDNDLDGDGIHDMTYHALISTFRNVSSVLLSKFHDKKISFGEILSLMDKKHFDDTIDGNPTVFSSMVQANKILRNEIEALTATHPNLQSVIISASTVRTSTEESFRQHSPDKEYWAPCPMIAEKLVDAMNTHANIYEDIDVYVPHPDYHVRFQNENDKAMTERLIKEIGLH